MVTRSVIQIASPWQHGPSRCCAVRRRGSPCGLLASLVYLICLRRCFCFGNRCMTRCLGYTSNARGEDA
jgi:hypothetical protein